MKKSCLLAIVCACIRGAASPAVYFSLCLAFGSVMVAAPAHANMVTTELALDGDCSGNSLFTYDTDTGQVDTFSLELSCDSSFGTWIGTWQSGDLDYTPPPQDNLNGWFVWDEDDLVVLELYYDDFDQMGKWVIVEDDTFEYETGTFQVVPIPAALSLFASGLAGLGLFGQRRPRKVAGSTA